MKRAVVTAVFVAAVVGASTASGEGLALTLKPGLVINAAQIGYQSDMLFLGGGLEFASVSFVSKSTYESGGVEHKSTTNYGVSAFLPQLAGRVYFGPEPADGQGGQARPYAGATLFYSIATANITNSDGETTYRDTTTERLVRDALGGNLGGTVAFGGEYRIAGGLSLAGEFGVRYLFGGVKSESAGYEWTETMDTRLGLGVTYTTFGLNFHF